MFKAEGLVRKHIKYIHHIKIHWCHMGVIFMPKHQIWKILQCVHILSLIMLFHTGNVYCGAVLTVVVSIFLTKKQLENMRKQHPQLGFTFTTSLDVPAWASGSERNTSLFPMLGVTSSILQFLKPKNFQKRRLQMFRPTRSSKFSRCWVTVSWGVLVQKN